MLNAEPRRRLAQNEKKQYVANEEYKEVPGAVLRVGNLLHSASDGLHSADDAVLTASGPGSEMVHGFMDNTEVFQVMVNAPSRIGFADAPQDSKELRWKAEVFPLPPPAGAHQGGGLQG